MARKILDLSGLDYYDGKIKAYVEAKAGGVASGKITMRVIDGSLPQSTFGYEHDVIYLVANNQHVSDNVYDEYIVVGSSGNEHFEKIGTTQADLNAKANANELTITPGTGANADKTTIQLKTGVSATVLTQHQDISGKANRASSPTAGHLASLDANGHLVDSGIDKDDAMYESDVTGITTGEIDTMFPDDDDKGIPDQGEATRIDFYINDGTTTTEYEANDGANWTGWCNTSDNTLGLVPVWVQEGSGRLVAPAHRVRYVSNSVRKELQKSEGSGVFSRVNADTAIEANVTYVLSDVVE